MSKEKTTKTLGELDLDELENDLVEAENDLDELGFDPVSGTSIT